MRGTIFDDLDIEGACGQLVVKSNTQNNNKCGNEKENCNCNNNDNKNNDNNIDNNSQQNKQNEIQDVEDLHMSKKPNTEETIPSESFWGNIFKKFF